MHANLRRRYENRNFLSSHHQHAFLIFLIKNQKSSFDFFDFDFFD